jgi:hypothetical protein
MKWDNLKAALHVSRIAGSTILREVPMPHQHGKEYRIKLHKPDGSVHYGLWFDTYEELCREMANVSPL